jgi:hypothetical protein
VPRLARARYDKGEYRQYVIEDTVVGHGFSGAITGLKASAPPAGMQRRSNAAGLSLIGMPEQLGHCNLLERVGAGGLGTAFRARDTVVGRTVLVKNAAATVSHPNVAMLFEVVDRPDQLFLVFEFVPGETLHQASARPFEIRRILDLGI